jgi:hypothetical protein
MRLRSTFGDPTENLQNIQTTTKNVSVATNVAITRMAKEATDNNGTCVII